MPKKCEKSEAFKRIHEIMVEEIVDVFVPTVTEIVEGSERIQEIIVEEPRSAGKDIVMSNFSMSRCHCFWKQAVRSLKKLWIAS